MKKIIFAILLLFVFISNINAVTLPIEVESDTVVLFNIEEEEVIYEKNPDKVQVLASLTKIMTAYTAINNVQNIKTKVTITEEDITGLEGFTVVGLQVGDVVTIEDLLYATLLESGADSSKALANHIAGSEAEFVKMMDQEADNLFLRNTNFEDSFGGNDDNIATGREICFLLVKALKNETFKEIFQSTYYTMSNGRRVVNYTRSIATFHGLDDTLLTGNKPGYTEVAGLLLASTATINGTEYAIVVMNAPMNPYQSTHVLDTYKVLDLVSTKNFEKRTILEKGTLLKKIKVVDGTINEYPVYLDKDIKKILSDEDFANVRTEYNIVDKLDSTSKVGDNVGFVDVFVGDELIATENVYIKDTIYDNNTDDSYKHNLIIPSLALMVSFFIVSAISIRLFFKSKNQPKKKKEKTKKEKKSKKDKK